MIKIKDVVFALNSAFPFDTALGFDNVGLLCGYSEAEVGKVLVCLDVTSAVINEAAEIGANLIVSHHPVIFRELKRITDETYTGRILLKLAELGISVVSAHTNFDRAAFGNNYALATLLGAEEMTDLEDGFAKQFSLKEEMFFDEFVAQVKLRTETTVVRTIGDGWVQNVISACGAGISESLIATAKQQNAVIVTADIKHNYAEMAKDMGVRVVELTHYASEWCACKKIADFLSEGFDGLQVSVSNENINPYNEVGEKE